MKKIYISLGSNIGNRNKYLGWAKDILAKSLNITNTSSIYESEFIGNTKQNDYLNQVIEFESDISIDDLFSITRQAENAIGRKRYTKWEPRIIDIDILLYGNEIIDQDDLNIPHPELISRRFVLEPLCEINNDIIIPPDNNPAKYYMENVMSQTVNIL